MELFIFDRGLNFQGMLEGYFSCIWRRRYSKSGDFELHCVVNDTSLQLLKQGNIIWKKDDLEAGYINYRQLHQDETGKEILVVKGRFLTNYLERRIIWDRKDISDTPENAIREVVNDNCINPYNINRKLPLLELGELKGYTGNANMQISYKNLLDTVEDISEVNGLGIRTILDIQNKKMIFDIYKGVDRTAGQNINSPAIFSQDFENVLEQEYIESMHGYKNTALIAGEGEGDERVKTTIEVGEGLDRYELFVDARDLQRVKYQDNAEVEIPFTEYIEILKSRGIDKLSEYRRIEIFDSKININSNLEYKKDFDLGDIVTITSKKWGVTINTRITEIEEIYEESGNHVIAAFGNDMPTLIDVIKREVR